MKEIFKKETFKFRKMLKIKSVHNIVLKKNPTKFVFKKCPQKVSTQKF